jgi:uncharacterized protein (TIGR02444 family)
VSWSSALPARPSGAFWRFSLDFYRRPGVAACCLDLQDRYGRDVNLLLFACWVGISGRGRLGVGDLARAESALEPWRREVVEKLRAVRRLVKDEADATELYASLESTELRAERVSQFRLESLARKPGAPGREERLADALDNLALYLGRGAAFGAAAPIRLALANEASQQS